MFRTAGVIALFARSRAVVLCVSVCASGALGVCGYCILMYRGGDE